MKGYVRETGRRSHEWDPDQGETVVDTRDGDRRGMRGTVLRVDQFGHFADPWWLAQVRWTDGWVEKAVSTVWVTRTDGSQGRLPRRRCISCGAWQIVAYEIDGNPIVLDGRPKEGAPIAVDLAGDAPTAFHNFDADAARVWDLPEDLPRFRRHDC